MRRYWRRILIGVLVTILIVVGAAAALAYWQASSIVDQLHAGPKAAVVRAVRPELHRPAKHPLVVVKPEPKAQTVLLIGSDRRWTGLDGARSDTIMLARIEPSRHRVSLLSIPRDLYVSIPGHGHDRINMAFRYGGERLLTQVVRETFGVTIDHFVEVDFRGFKNVVDKLGGVYVPVDQRYFNHNVGTSGTDYADIDLQPGYQKLNGTQALAFVRYRHTDNDFVRAARQQLLLRIVAHDALADDWNLLRVRRLALAAAKATTSDISSLGEIYSLAKTIHDTPGSRIVRLTVNASDLQLYGADYVSASSSQLRTTVRRWLGTPTRHARRVSARSAARTVTAVSSSPTPARLNPDGGRGRALVASVDNGMRTCAPSALPSGFWWPSTAVRSYALAGHPAIALDATAGSGDSILFMFTTWDDPPILRDPASTIRRGSRQYDLYTAGGKIRQIAWRVGATRVWITNTLEDTLGNAQMIALAESCR
jgi:polyisoprenyl-teichoic acid--peptidoglycan teichoic acid transferase